jgi:hypothetical protein
MSRVLFLGVNYGLECIEHGAKVLNGFTAYSEMLVNQIAAKARVDVVSDRKDRFPHCKVHNVFRQKNQSLTAFNTFWRKFHSVNGAGTPEAFSRDTIYRIVQMADSINPRKLELLLRSNTYDTVIFNRHEFFLFAGHPALASARKIACVHDSHYLRKRSYEELFSANQSLTRVESALERALVSQAAAIVCLSPRENSYFRRIAPKQATIVLLRPRISAPNKLRMHVPGQGVLYYFAGVNNFVNRETLVSALRWFEQARSSPLDTFHVFGSICDSMEVRRASGHRMHLHGRVPDLTKAISRMDVLLAPIHAGSGIPIKIADALSAGNIVITTKLGAEGYSEFVGTRILIANRSRKVDSQLIRKAKVSYAPYTQYNKENEKALALLTSTSET